MVRLVLCADDDAHIRDLVRATLESNEVETLLAANGIDALEAARRRRPDAILLDIHMPGLEGLQALDWIKSRPDLAQTPVMMLTSDSQADNVRQALAGGARDFLVKPFEPAELRARVRRLLGLEAPRPAHDPGVPLAHATGQPAEGTRVLLVARPVVLSIARSMLRDRCTVVAAATGAEALAWAHTESFDVALVEPTLPDMRGAELILRLVTYPGMAGIGTVGIARDGEWDRTERALFTATVDVPIVRDDLLAALERARRTAAG